MERPRPGRRFARLAAGVLLAGLLAPLAPTRTAAHDDDLARHASNPSSLDGTWRLVSPPPGNGRKEYKTIAGGRFIWYVVDGGRVVNAVGGRMSYREGRYSEWIEFSAADPTAWMVGGVGRFRVERRGDGWRHVGTVTAAEGERTASVDERWMRLP
jgi:hypothetical protein